MAPKSKSLAEQFADLDDPTPKDFDPEDAEHAGESDEEGSGADDDDAGREHYQAVGKSKLRQPESINLGKQYAGSRISRDALEDESDDDPFKARSGDEDEDDDEHDSEDDDEGGAGLEDGDSEEASDESEEERPKKEAAHKKLHQQQRPDSGVEVNGMETEGSDDIEGGDSEGLEDMDSDESEEDDEEVKDEGEDDEEDEVEDKIPRKGTNDREELRQLMATDQKTIAASISQAAKTDAVKGKAVKQQRSTFDALLNTRIKLQKGLTAVNQLSVAAKDADNVDTEAVKSAEAAALSLWTTLEDLRYALADAQSGESKKRKRPSPATSATFSASLWQRMAELESDSVAHRRAILDKWSLKVRGSSASLPNARGKLLGSGAGGQQTITAVLDAQLASEAGERSTKRARKQAVTNGNATESPEPIYDDTIFYQTLLRELVEQRMSSDSITNGLDTLSVQLPSRLSLHPVTGMRNDKNRRANVDTRASKGRKMRYDVHEKLQNFMAPEDRGTWTTRAREEFFASLLGRTASGLLGEGDEEHAGDGEESDDDREEVGLRLFRS